MPDPATPPPDSAGPRRTAGLSLKDVASLAGVSTKTVSNVLNDRPHISAGTRRRVEEAIAELGYRPNPAARLLKQGRTGVIALAIPDIELPYFAELAAAVHRVAERFDYTVLLDQTGGDEDKERLVATGFRAHLIDGLILSPLSLQPEELLDCAARRPTVLLGERFYDVQVDHIAVDNVAAGRDAVRHLLSRGRERIAMIGEDEFYAGPAGLRKRGYVEALSEAGLDVDDDLVLSAGLFQRIDGMRATQRLLDSGTPFDAIFAFNDTLALGAIRCLHDHGLAVPDDVAVVGFDDVEEGRFSTPRLTTIAPDKEQIAELAVTRLMGRLRGDLDDSPQLFSTAHRLVVRESA
ncbi:LacI family DNA-binding transcriptional regulator [Saccharopolyspora terrae]|uniref:LacI family DNA-binding transcriptional regulator n=1 Tax=Saccharopolyspora terrae TaxID=2530384 RepID=UPI001AA00B3E|nr:LacI family DNA-binding transcriptional regulator [Saccharopolyspora terrae]